MISVDLLLAWGGSYKKFEGGELIFEEGSNCYFYHQLVSGKVKWVNVNDEGKEYIQNIVEPGESFGEIPLFDDGLYVATAIAIEACVVIRLPKKTFIQVMMDNPDLSFAFGRLLARRLRYKFIILKTNAFENPEKRITVLLNYLKQEKQMHGDEPFLVDLTRQQIANMTGLRVETVIRTIRQMNERGELVIEHVKIFL